MPKVLFENETFNAEEPLQEEKDLLRKQVFRYIAASNNFLTNLFEDNWPNILAALGVAKHELKAPFKGMSAGDGEIALQLIRPAHVIRTTGATETAANDWSVTFTADSDYWIGFGTNNTTAINVDKRLLLLPMAVWYTQGVAPTVEELLIQAGGTTYPKNIIRHSFVADNPTQIRAARIRPLLLKPKSTLLVQVYSTVAHTQQLVLVGLAFVMGDLARADEPTTIQT